MEEQDYLRLMFENYFKIAKKVLNDEEVVDGRRIRNAIYGALSGVDYHGKLLDDVLDMLIKDLPIIVKEAERVRADSSQEENNEGMELMCQEDKSGWLDLKKLREKYPIVPKSVKDSKWREKESFPCTHVGGRVHFNAQDVEKWLFEHGNN